MTANQNPVKAIDDKTAAHVSNKQNAIMCRCGH